MIAPALDAASVAGGGDVGAARAVVAEKADGKRGPVGLAGRSRADVVAPTGKDVAMDADEERVGDVEPAPRVHVVVLDDPDTAARMYERLVSEYPDSRYTNKASKALRSLNEEEFDEEED